MGRPVRGNRFGQLTADGMPTWKLFAIFGCIGGGLLFSAGYVLWLIHAERDAEQRKAVRANWHYADAQVRSAEDDLKQAERRYGPDDGTTRRQAKELAGRKEARQRIEDQARGKWGKHPRDL